MRKDQTMKQPSKEGLPERVPFSAIPTGETPSLFAQEGLIDMAHLGLEPSDIAQWAHRSVWTDRMLETLLNNKVRGGKWHALNDKVFSESNLLASARKVLEKKGAAGVDQQPSPILPSSSGMNSVSCVKNFARGIIVLRRYVGRGFPNQAARS